MKRIFALVLSLVFLLSCLVLPAGAMFDPSPVYQVQAASAYIVNTDTNIISRSSRERQLALTEELKALLAQTPYPDKDALAALDDRFIAENLSPGGSADLLALTWLLHFVTTEGNINE